MENVLKFTATGPGGSTDRESAIDPGSILGKMTAEK